MIRKIEAKDKAEYINMATDFYSSPAVLSSVSSAHFEDTFSELMRSEIYAEAFIFENDGKITGYGLIAKTFSQEAGGLVVWIEEIYVKESYRNMGLGSKFIEFIKTNVPAARYRLETEPDNTKAQQLYKRHGFEKFEYINYKIDI